MIKIGSALLLVFVADISCAAPCPIHGQDATAKRVTMKVAEHNGVVTVATEGLFGRFKADAAADAACAAAKPADRALCLRCVMRAAVDAFIHGNTHEFRALNEKDATDFDINRFFEHHKEGSPSPTWPKAHTVTFNDVTYVNGAARIRVDATGPKGEYAGVAALFARHDPDSTRWRLTPRLYAETFPIGIPNHSIVLAQRPSDMSVYRLRYIDDGSKYLRVSMEPVPTGAKVAHDDMLVYVRLEPVAHADAPLLTLEPGTLDPAMRQVQKALHAQLKWLVDDSAGPSLAACFEPGLQKKIQKQVLNWRDPIGRKQNFFNAGLIQPDQALIGLHLTTRVDVGTGYVWFGWAPMPKALRGHGDAALVTLHQIRMPDGSWKMLMQASDDRDKGANYARRLLDNYTHLCGPVIREARAATLQPLLQHGGH